MITIVALVLLSASLITMDTLSLSKEFKQRSEEIRVEYLSQQKALIQQEVKRATDLIEAQRLYVKKKIRGTVKERVYNAMEIAENIYQQNKNSKSSPEIKKMIRDVLQNIHFDQGTANYFIICLDGSEVLLNDRSGLDGNFLLNIKDSSGRPVVKGMIDTLKTSGGEFYEYNRTKLHVSGSDHEKIAYVKLFKPYQWLIGTEIYVKDMENHIKQDLLVLLSEIHFGENGYIFVNKSDGTALVAKGKVLSGSQKVWEFYAEHPDRIKIAFNQARKAALNPEGGYVYSTIRKTANSDQEYSKVSYIKGVPGWEWFVGAGVSLDNVEQKISLLQSKLDQQRRSQITRTLLVTVVILSMILIIFYLVSRRLKKDMEVFVSYFGQVADEGKEIDCSGICFDGLYNVAENVNTILHEKYEVMEQLSLSEEKYRSIFNTAQVGIFRTRISDGLFLEINQKAADMFNLKIEEVVGKIRSIDLFKDLRQREDLLACIEKDGFVDNFEVDFIHASGREAFYIASIRAFPREGYLEGVVIDVTEKKHADTQLHLSEERFRKMAELLPEAVFETNLDLNLTYANRRALELFGYTEADLEAGLSSYDIFVSEEHEKLSNNIALQFRGEKTERTEYRCHKKDGTLFSALFRVSPIIKDSKPDGIRGVVIDLTEQKKAAKLLQESEERFRTLAELLPEAVFETDINMILTYSNQRAFEIYGYTRADYSKGLNSLNMFAPEEREKVLKNTAAQFCGEKNHSTEYLSVKKDGTVFPVLFHVSPILKEGKPAGLRGIIIDLTEHRRAEEEILKLRKLESVGVLAGGIAHDFNNLLAGLFGNIEMAKRFLETDHKSHKYLESAGISMERATSLTQQLLTFAKGGDPIKEILSVAEIIEETAKFSLRGSNVKLTLNIAEDLWLVNADKGQLSQVVSNLVINGKQAMPDGGVITITAKNMTTGTEQQVQICVKDQGIGIAPQHLDKIFDPYFSTKQQGSGLGLASCFSIINKHNGTIRVTSELNRGTFFTITLPAVVKSVGKSSRNEEQPLINCATTARILMLEDEELVRQMSGSMLDEMGHQVDHAVHGEEAVKKWIAARDRGEPYDIALCDLTIPGGMGGHEAAQQILEHDPLAKLIVSSGYANDPVMADYLNHGFSGRLAKPYRFSDLQQEVERVLTL